MLKVYPATFLGCDLCSWLASDAAGEFQVNNREEAVVCGMAMFHFKVTQPAACSRFCTQLKVPQPNPT